MNIRKISLPLTKEEILNLHIGDAVLISGKIYTARDAAHQKLLTLIKENKPLPIELSNSSIYYTGPTPTKPGEIIGSAGPTSSYRMDPFMKDLLKKGLKITIGKGPRSKEVKTLCKDYQAIYFSAIGGTAANIASCVKACKEVCYPELESESIKELIVENMFVVVAIDAYGNSIYDNNKEIID